MASTEESLMENDILNEMEDGRKARNISSSSLLQKSDQTFVSNVPHRLLREFLANLQLVLLGTKLSLLFPAIPLAIVAHCYGFGRPWVFALSFFGLIPLAERISFLTEQIAYYTTPTVAGLLNATCGNATELIIVIFALIHRKVDVVKYSLLGSVLSEILLVLGSSLLCGGLANFETDQKFDKKQANVNLIFLFLALVCHTLPLMFQYAGKSPNAKATLELSRVSSIVMLIVYSAYIAFQLLTHRALLHARQDIGFRRNEVSLPYTVVAIPNTNATFSNDIQPINIDASHHFVINEDEEEDENEDMISEESPVIGFWSGFLWLAVMTVVTALLSEYIVNTIEVVSESWGISVSFISIILLPFVGNATEHAAAILFALKNKLDLSLGVALGSATQIAMFVVPLSVIVAWIMDIKMDLDLKLLGTVSLALSILITALTLQDATSNYLKGLGLVMCYFVVGACFFLSKAPIDCDLIYMESDHHL